MYNTAPDSYCHSIHRFHHSNPLLEEEEDLAVAKQRERKGNKTVSVGVRNRNSFHSRSCSVREEAKKGGATWKPELLPATYKVGLYALEGLHLARSTRLWRDGRPWAPFCGSAFLSRWENGRYGRRWPRHLNLRPPSLSGSPNATASQAATPGKFHVNESPLKAPDLGCSAVVEHDRIFLSLSDSSAADADVFKRTEVNSR